LYTPAGRGPPFGRDRTVLFNSYEFIFALLPIGLAVYYAAVGADRRDLGLAWLVAVSLFFYAWWNPTYLWLIGASILGNFALGTQLARTDRSASLRRRLLILGIGANLGLLGWYKYSRFAAANLSALTGLDLHLEPVVLPLAISFFTFVQLTFLVDAYRGIVRDFNLLHYALFVTFFPHLIAGPIVHHKDLMPQFARKQVRTGLAGDLAVGFTYFAIGLLKKTVLADNVAPFATRVFDAAHAGAPLHFFEAWGGALAYTVQLYFDFSGYADMAIGASRMFGILLPLNFASPYKATSIIEFWRRWHMTLSRFLRDYLYIPLGGNRSGTFARYRNLMITMLLGGLWHGAGWTFVLWGGLHGFYLVVNHALRALRARFLGHDLARPPLWVPITGAIATQLAVVVGWVFFRAGSLDAALSMLHAMAGGNGFDAGVLADIARARLAHRPPPDPTVWLGSFGRVLGFAWIAVLFAIAWLLPATHELLHRYEPALMEGFPLRRGRFEWKPTWPWAVALASLAAVGVLYVAGVSEFLYFQF
jgi:D-alanyl-lipoteichoic acid acyltransferase DltB (MBOAT superfamily)